MVARVSLASPRSARVQAALNSFSRVARFVRDPSSGCCVVLLIGISHLPSSLRALAASAAAAICPSDRPASSALSDTTSAASLAAARRALPNFALRAASSSFSFFSAVLSASESFAPAITNCWYWYSTSRSDSGSSFSLRAVLVDGLEPVEQRGVEVDRILMGGELRRHGLLLGLERVVGIRARDRVEGVLHACEGHARSSRARRGRSRTSAAAASPAMAAISTSCCLSASSNAGAKSVLLILSHGGAWNGSVLGASRGLDAGVEDACGAGAG